MSIVSNLANAHSLQPIVFPDFIYSNVAEADSSINSANKFKATAHLAQVGDIIVFTSGPFAGLSTRVITIDTDYITVQQPLPSAPPAGTGFVIYRIAGTTSAFNSLALTTTGDQLKSSPGRIAGWCITNLVASIRYIKIYNRASVNPAVHVPDLRIALPANGHSVVGFPIGSEPFFDTAIYIRGVTGVGDTDTTSHTANDVSTSILYR